MNKKVDVKAVFDSLQAGDGLIHNCGRPGCIAIHNTAVLKVGEDEQGRFVCVSYTDEQMHFPWHLNPLRWDAERRVVVNRDGYEIMWFSTDIQYERGSYLNEVEKYQLLPRPENLSKRFSEEDLKVFADSPEGATLAERFALIFANSENALVDTIALCLQTLGIEPTPKNLDGIVTMTAHLIRIQESQTPAFALVNLGDRSPVAKEKARSH